MGVADGVLCGDRDLPAADARWRLLRQGPAELKQDGCLFLFGDRDAGNGEGAAVAGFEFDIDHDDLPEMLEDLPRGQRGGFGGGELFEADVHGASEESDHDVGFDTLRDLVPDRTHLDFAFDGAEGGFGLGELHIRLPE